MCILHALQNHRINDKRFAQKKTKPVCVVKTTFLDVQVVKTANKATKILEKWVIEVNQNLKGNEPNNTEKKKGEKKLKYFNGWILFKNVSKVPKITDLEKQ